MNSNFNSQQIFFNRCNLNCWGFFLPTSAPGLQLLLHQLFGGGKLTVLHFGHDVIGADGADDFRLLLVAVLRLDVDPGDFPGREPTAGELLLQRRVHIACTWGTLFLFLFFFFFMQTFWTCRWRMPPIRQRPRWAASAWPSRCGWSWNPRVALKRQKKHSSFLLSFQFFSHHVSAGWCSWGRWPSLHEAASSPWARSPMKSMTFQDHFKGIPDLCMQTQMKTDSPLDEKGKVTQGWSTHFWDMLKSGRPRWFARRIPNTDSVNHAIDRRDWSGATVSQPQVGKKKNTQKTTKSVLKGSDVACGSNVTQGVTLWSQREGSDVGSPQDSCLAGVVSTWERGINLQPSSRETVRICTARQLVVVLLLFVLHI